jgi:hypothetical protein
MYHFIPCNISNDYNHTFGFTRIKAQRYLRRLSKLVPWALERWIYAWRYSFIYRWEIQLHIKLQVCPQSLHAWFTSITRAILSFLLFSCWTSIMNPPLLLRFVHQSLQRRGCLLRYTPSQHLGMTKAPSVHTFATPRHDQSSTTSAFWFTCCFWWRLASSILCIVPETHLLNLVIKGFEDLR